MKYHFDSPLCVSHVKSIWMRFGQTKKRRRGRSAKAEGRKMGKKGRRASLCWIVDAGRRRSTMHPGCIDALYATWIKNRVPGATCLAANDHRRPTQWKNKKTLKIKKSSWILAWITARWEGFRPYFFLPSISWLYKVSFNKKFLSKISADLPKTPKKQNRKKFPWHFFFIHDFNELKGEKIQNIFFSKLQQLLLISAFIPDF